MSKKWLPILIIVLLGILLIVIKKCKNDSSPEPKQKTTTDPAAKVNRDRGFDRRTSFIQYSNHAKCRMDCRHITQTEVEEIMREGKINYNKSDLQNTRCPRYALEGVTGDDQRVRIVFAQCNESTTVVTVIDLGTDFECHCPGDDDKYKNRN